MLIQEAYEVLSHPKRRKQYDYERRLSGHLPSAAPFSSEFLIRELKKLQQQLSVSAPPQIDRQQLFGFMLYALEADRIAILQMSATPAQIREILGLYRMAKPFLPAPQYLLLLDRLLHLADQLPDETRILQEEVKETGTKIKWQKIQPLIWLLVTVLLCLTMYWYGRSRS